MCFFNRMLVTRYSKKEFKTVPFLSCLLWTVVHPLSLGS